MNGTNRIPFLSICIPTYNRAEHVFSMVKDILLCQSEEIEVVILDNCSTDETKNRLRSIDDNRFVYIQNTSNIGGILNSVKVLTIAKGEYTLLCLDRDYIDFQYIPTLIESLQKEDDVVLGYCSLGLKEMGSDLVFEKGFDSVLNMAYLSKHPSGDFYKTAVLKQLKIIEEINNKTFEFAFYHELINAEASFLGRSKRINIPLIKTGYFNAKNDFELNKSHSYSSNNYYFKPLQRKVEFSMYMFNASMLNLSAKEKKWIYISIFFRGLISSTFSYKKALMDSKICSHYRIETRKVSFFELLVYDLDYSLSFMKQNISISFFQKLYICSFAHFKIFYRILKHIVK